ncbi:hypothetical protein AB205_0044650 [Aquarana catesbeiana]|uniref:Uncharacterized protein n=1 Tax=Aquarana catesbeiana TaxID=8400 RepID=A0A2G9S5M9_AQUCT|nr:hypothetical protein AB205_0044650 [Aquarana catesbeiana]
MAPSLLLQLAQKFLPLFPYLIHAHPPGPQMPLVLPMMVFLLLGLDFSSPQGGRPGDPDVASPLPVHPSWVSDLACGRIAPASHRLFLLSPRCIWVPAPSCMAASSVPHLLVILEGVSARGSRTLRTASLSRVCASSPLTEAHIAGTYHGRDAGERAVNTPSNHDVHHTNRLLCFLSFSFRTLLCCIRRVSGYFKHGSGREVRAHNDLSPQHPVTPHFPPHLVSLCL